jgi:hypothetical protein
LLLEQGQLLLQSSEDPGDAFGDERIGESFQTIAFGVTGLFQFVVTAH